MYVSSSISKFKPYLTRELNGGTQTLYKFDNNYGASVIRGGKYAYGGLELAVIIHTNPLDPDDGWELTYDTSITDDVVGYLTEEDIPLLLEQIRNLPGPVA